MTCKHSLPEGVSSWSGVITVTAPTYTCSFCEMERLQAENAKLKSDTKADLEAWQGELEQIAIAIRPDLFPQHAVNGARLAPTLADVLREAEILRKSVRMDYEARSEFRRLLRADVDQGKRIAELMAENERLSGDVLWTRICYDALVGWYTQIHEENERLQKVECKERCAVTEADRDQYRDDYNELLAMLGVDRDNVDNEHAVAKAAIRRLQNRPPMACGCCEDLNLDLSDKNDALEAENAELRAACETAGHAVLYDQYTEMRKQLHTVLDALCWAAENPLSEMARLDYSNAGETVEALVTEYADAKDEIERLKPIEQGNVDLQIALAREGAERNRLQVENERVATQNELLFRELDTLRVREQQSLKDWTTLRTENERLAAVGEDLVVDHGQLQIRIAELEEQVKWVGDWSELFQRLTLPESLGGGPIWPNNWNQDTAFVAFTIDGLRKRLELVERTANARQAMLHDINATCLLAIGFVEELIGYVEPTSAAVERIAEIRAAIAPSKPTFALVEATRELVKTAVEFKTGGQSMIGVLRGAIEDYEKALAALEKQS